MSVSAVEICNLSLLKFGNLQITSITAPTNKEERTCAVLYPIMRDFLTSMHPWNFAMHRKDITANVTTTPAFQWDYAYTLPTDPLCLRVWEVYDYEDDWEVEGNLLLINLDDDVYIRYIKQVTETGYFPMPYVMCLAQLLGAELAAKLMGDGGITKRDALLKEFYSFWLPEARRLNAMEGRKVRTSDDKALDDQSYTWQSEGR